MGICSIFERKKFPYEVTVHLDGRHPYLKETHLDFETRDVTLTILATSFNDAEKQAFCGINGLKYWRASVTQIRKAWKYERED